MTNSTSEREQRLKQIRERRAKLLEERPTLSWEVQPFNCMCDEACKPFTANAPKDIDFLLSLLDSEAAGDKRIAVLHSIGISGVGGSISDFWEHLNNLSGDKQIAFCQALHQLCEIMGHNNQWKCDLCEKMGARNVQGYYTGDRFFDGTKKDYIR